MYELSYIIGQFGHQSNLRLKDGSVLLLFYLAFCHFVIIVAVSDSI